ncbi:MAG: YkgJ family cysteine cluster protein [Planctomycetes bacterium]|nr:YkgJ family cysteine cluster protein [Planctomycetota bacterium]
MSKTVPIHLPLFQRFDCHRCGYCCRNLVVNVTAEERRRIISAGWVERLVGTRLFESYRFLGRRYHRLAHRQEGGCVFLGQDGLCRLHAETGSEIKPLACRLYPFVPSPGADVVRVDLRFDCPSVAANKGRSLGAHTADIAALAAEMGARPMDHPPAWRGQRSTTPREFTALAAAFEGLLRREGSPIRQRLLAGCQLPDLLYGLRIARVRNDRFAELMSLLADAASEEAWKASPNAAPPAMPARAGKLFRQWLFLHSLADDPQDLAIGLVGRRFRSWRRYRESRRFSAGSGPVPAIRPDWPSASFEDLLRVEPAPDEALEPVCRALRVKLETHAFSGPAYFGYETLAGLTALWLMPGVAGWFARLQAVGKGSATLTPEAVIEGLRQAHHTFGISPVFRRISERFRLRALARPGIPAAILAKYGP